METETAPSTGRREANRRRTHRAIVQAAARLFQEQGYEATTVRDIAVAAGVGERTFFRYFPSKESLILQQVRDLIPLLCDHIRERPSEERALLALRNAVLAMSPHESAVILLSGPPYLGPGQAGRGEGFLLRDMEEAVTAAFLDRLTAAGADPAEPGTGLDAAVLARAGVGVLRAVRSGYVRLPEEARAGVDVLGYVRRAFAVLDGTAQD